MKTFFRIVLTISIIMIFGNLIMTATRADFFCPNTEQNLWIISLVGFCVGAIGGIVILFSEKEVEP